MKMHVRSIMFAAAVILALAISASAQSGRVQQTPTPPRAEDTILAEWTSDKKQMLAAVKRTNFGRKDVFVDALKLATDFLLKSGLENKHLVLITDGTDSNGRSSAKFDAFQRLFATDISVHVLSY